MGERPVRRGVAVGAVGFFMENEARFFRFACKKKKKKLPPRTRARHTRALQPPPLTPIPHTHALPAMYSIPLAARRPGPGAAPLGRPLQSPGPARARRTPRAPGAGPPKGPPGPSSSRDWDAAWRDMKKGEEREGKGGSLV